MEDALVRQLLSLAAIDAGDAQIEALTRDLTRIHESMEKLREADLDAMEPTFGTAQPVGVRDDVVEPSLEQSTVLAAAPEHDGERIVVPSAHARSKT